MGRRRRARAGDPQAGLELKRRLAFLGEARPASSAATGAWSGSYPALWLLGGVDQHVPTARTLELLAQVRSETGADLSWEVFPRGQHFLIEGERGLLDEISRSQRYVPGLFEAIERWLRAKGFFS